ncbi:hypothetical protein GL297_12855 [Komagataeibacter sp. FXV2]|nr:hypothetical protein [Komagataeibacter sp. FXV2]
MMETGFLSHALCEMIFLFPATQGTETGFVHRIGVSGKKKRPVADFASGFGGPLDPGG